MTEVSVIREASADVCELLTNNPSLDGPAKYVALVLALATSIIEAQETHQGRNELLVRTIVQLVQMVLTEEFDVAVH